MRTAPHRPAALRLLLATLTALTALLCTTALVAGVASPAEAAPKPAKVKKKDIAFKKPRIDNGRAGFTVNWKSARRATRYKAKLIDAGRTQKKTVIVRKSKAVFTGLNQNTGYCVKIRAYNGKRKGAWSQFKCTNSPSLSGTGAPWVTAQSVGAMSLTWDAVGGATSYEVDYAPGTSDVQKDKQKRTVRVGANGATITGLVPGKIYCFQVRAQSRHGNSVRSPAHCHQTMDADRVAPARAFALTMGSYNLCVNVCENQGRAWAPRQPGVVNRIKNSGVDAVAVQESREVANEAIGDTATTGYEQACKVGDGYGNDYQNQALFVRTSTYRVVEGSNSGLRFPGEVHGGCWAEVEHRTSGQHVVLVATHMIPGPGGTNDATRKWHTQLLWDAIQAHLGTRVVTGVPIVFAGDFNSNRDRANDGPREALAPYGYDDAYDVAASYSTPSNHNTFNAWSMTPLKSSRWGNHLDRVFAPPRVHVSQWGVIEPMGADGRYNDLLSDHSFLAVTLQMPY